LLAGLQLLAPDSYFYGYTVFTRIRINKNN